MRKKSHILLARCLADHTWVNELKSHRKAFCLGSILPDIRPSFLTTKHEFSVNYAQVERKIRTLTVENNLEEYNARVYWRQLGEVTHHVADYFTFPHNETFEGTLLEHGKYEAELKRNLKETIKSGAADKYCQSTVKFDSLDELLTFLKTAHKIYVSRERNIKDDIQFIVTICYQVMQGMIRIFQNRLQGLEVVMA
ncbi:MAG: zinc dependent phospholipase C family protein [Lachnospiraceae bacterium]|nr:zinc dependent phospholipase C family protein [Lachnospiraceae bacterium]